MRDVATEVMRRLYGVRLARHATLAVALNGDVAARYHGVARMLIVEPNCALGEVADRPGRAPARESGALGGPRTALFVGRLIAWKGLRVAVETMRYAPGWRLVVLGDGPDRRRIEPLVAAYGLSARVEFRGRVDRAEVLEAFAHVDALLAPSFHDSAPWALGEASSVGCPVVCLDAGGLALLAAGNAHPVAVEPTATLPQRLAHELRQLTGRGAPDHSWRASRVPNLLARWYTAGGCVTPIRKARPPAEVRRHA